MTASGIKGAASGVDGQTGHIPVLLAEAISALRPAAGGIFLDGTFGRGGYSRAILNAAQDVQVIALDRDPSAIAGGAALQAEYQGRFSLAEARFSDMEAAAESLGQTAFDGVVLDIGVSSMQIDDGSRGFSFRRDGPLDMRMGGSGRSAEDIVNQASEAELADIFYFYGEERHARPLARAVVAARRDAPIKTTRMLADLAGRAVRHRSGDIHPATRAFQALRIAVNDELMQLVEGLHAAERLLKTGGRLAVVTFHSLEDRIVKQFFSERSGRSGGSRHRPAAAVPAATFIINGKWPVTPGDAELASNPRSRSAKLRAGTRTDAGPAAPIAALRELASLPAARERRRK